MSLQTLNAKKQETTEKNIEAVKKILKKNPGMSTKDIQQALKTLGVNASHSSIKRYKKAVIKQPVEAPKAEAPITPRARPKAVYPFEVFCPQCHSSGLITSNENQTIECPRCGLGYDRKTKTWIDLKRAPICKNAYDFKDFCG